MTFVSFSAMQTNKATPAALSVSAEQENQSANTPLTFCSYFII